MNEDRIPPRAASGPAANAGEATAIDDGPAPDGAVSHELERLLARYARVRLDPTTAQSRRARAAVMEAAWRRRLEGPPADVDAVTGLPLVERRRGGRRASDVGGVRGDGAGRSAAAVVRTGRQVAASLAMAIVLGAASGGLAFAGTRPGAPLYEGRLAIEALTLPADPAARVEAQLALARARLAELLDANARGDDRAVRAAADAYAMTVGSLGGEADGVPAGRAAEAILHHREVLEEVAARVAAAARPGLERALAANARSADRLAAAGRPPAAGDEGDPNPNGGGGDGAPSPNGDGDAGNGTTPVVGGGRPEGGGPGRDEAGGPRPPGSKDARRTSVVTTIIRFRR